ncbi:hypothetical protein IQ268_08840 [Oculatella sp. LEGE 06141]|uniref:hypothetical protein n=1 Tax=Oculatella sp. LEGE 06141 TaxID=1828648 RepID=UPI00187E97EB|nr:hypothetical protein [Oculatella sp. LEGE 06141]MBE9178664.1 hypothetical protein [Oculatella sp. LEGE 06141]
MIRTKYTDKFVQKGALSTADVAALKSQQWEDGISKTPSEQAFSHLIVRLMSASPSDSPTTAQIATLSTQISTLSTRLTQIEGAIATLWAAIQDLDKRKMNKIL